MTETATPPAPVADPPAPPAPPEADPPKMFDQAAVDRIVQERLARAKSEPPADYEEAKAALAKLAEIEAANKSDLEKAQEAAAKAEADRDAAIEKAKTATLRSSILAAASKAGAVDPDDVFALLDKDAVTIGDDGQVTGADDAVKALLAAKPHLVGKSSITPTGSPDGGPQGTPGPAQLSRDDLKTMTPEAITEAKAKGQLNTLLGITTP